MYRIFDILIESNIPILELPEISQGESSISFQLSKSSFHDESQLEWYHHWRLPNGDITISCAKYGDNYFLRFPALADFWISQSCDQIECFAKSDVSDETVRHLLVDQVIPRVVAHQGNVVLHASAIELKGGVIAFLGESGWGKSTLAISFYEQGYPLLTDDCLLLKPEAGKIITIPSYIGARLLPDSLKAIVSDKIRVHSMAHYSSKKRLIFPESKKIELFELPLRAIFELVSPDESKLLENISVEQVIGSNMIIALAKHSFYLDITDTDKISAQFEILGNVAESGLSIYRLKYPRELSVLEKVRDRVLQAAVPSSTMESSTS